MSGWRKCDKCGQVMQLKIGIGYIYYWQCPNGCKQENCKYTASSTTNIQQIKPMYSNNSGV